MRAEKSHVNPRHIYENYILEEDFQLSTQSKNFFQENGIWMIRLDEQGKYINGCLAPKEVIHDYSPQDLVRSTRWYLEDYPIFTYLHENQIVIIGYPPELYSKFPTNYYNIDLFFKTFYLFAFIFVFAIVLLFLLYYYSKKKLWQEIEPVRQGILDLSENKLVKINESGHLTDIKKALNQTSETLQKNKKDREIWLRGISHDLRTPLTVVSGYSQSLQKNQENAKELAYIEKNIQRMEKILEGLNISYMIENFDPREKNEKVDLKKVLREISVDILNRSSSDKVQIQSDFPPGEFIIQGKQDLIYRALQNVLLNSIVHNEKVEIFLKIEKIDKEIILTVLDNGGIGPDKVEEIQVKKENQSEHGFGILIVKKIIALHGGDFKMFYANPGLKTEFRFTVYE